MAARANAGCLSAGKSGEWAPAAPEVSGSSISGVLNLTLAGSIARTTPGTDHVCGLGVLQGQSRV